MQDKDIIALYFQRDERAISETADKYGVYCHKIAYNILSDVFDAEECVGDTYMRAWSTIPPTYPRILSAFLGRITRNLAIDRYNSAHSKKRGGRVALSLDELRECISEGSPWDTLEGAELGEIINSFLSEQRELVRRIFVSRYFYQSSVSQIAARYGISQSRVKTTLHRARTSLAKYLLERGISI